MSRLSDNCEVTAFFVSSFASLRRRFLPSSSASISPSSEPPQPMSAYLREFLSRRRNAREAAAAAAAADAERLFAEENGGSPAEMNGSTAGDDDKLASLPYIPSCCGDTDPSKPPPPSYPIKILRNIPYYTGPFSTSRHELDIYYSPSALKHHLKSRVDQGRDGVPVVIHVHGGGWQRGDRKNEWRGGPCAGRSIARHGLIAVVPSYRLAPPAFSGMVIISTIIGLLLTLILCIPFSSFRQNFLLYWFYCFLIGFMGNLIRRIYLRNILVQHPESVRDIARCVKWVREELKREVNEKQSTSTNNNTPTTIVPIDTSRIFLSGHSAGGHLISLLCTDPKYFLEVGITNSSEFIRGVCSISGVYNLMQPIHPSLHSYKNYLFRLTYGAAAFGMSWDGLKDASPYTHLKRVGKVLTEEKKENSSAASTSSIAPARDIPWLIMSATSDLGLEIDASAFVAKLASLGIQHEYHIIKETTHASIASHFEKHEAHQHLFRFIEKCCSTEGEGEKKDK